MLIGACNMMLCPNWGLQDKAQFLLEGEMNYRMRHENIVRVTGYE